MDDRIFKYKDNTPWFALHRPGSFSIFQANEKIGAEGKQAALVVSPAIRKQISSIVRQHIEDIVVMGFTELPDNRKINIVASIGEDIDKE